MDMFFVSLFKPTREEEARVTSKGQSLGFNYKSHGSSRGAPPLPEAAQGDGWWKIGYGRKTYDATKDLLGSWGQFQLPWAQVRPDTPIKAGAPVCVAANVLGLWTAVPLQLLYAQEGSWHEDGGSKRGSGVDRGGSGGGGSGGAGAAPDKRVRRRRHGREFSYACGCLRSHFLAGEERFKVEWDKSDDSVWYDIYTFSRPAHPLAFAGYPLVRALQARFRHDSARAVARAAAAGTVERCIDAKTRRRLALAEGLDDAA